MKASKKAMRKRESKREIFIVHYSLPSATGLDTSFGDVLTLFRSQAAQNKNNDKSCLTNSKQ